LTKLVSTFKDLTISEDAEHEIHSFLTSDLGAALPLHISLSRPIGFATERKDAFVDSLVRAVKSSGIRPFDISFVGLDWVSNFEKTRWFLVLRLKRPDSDGLNKLLHVSNQVVQEYGQLPLYANAPTPSKISKNKISTRKSPKSPWVDMDDASGAFHISIAWTLSSPSQELLELTESTTENYMENISQLQVKVEEIKSKVGNFVTNIPLPQNFSVGKGLFEV